MEEAWEEKMKSAFKELMVETFGTDETKPGCCGSGDSKPFCERCGWRDAC